uniref:Uncharacterized protein n=1 Tax=Nelumbo nucifera TaxID=4432 RepID=A0A822XKJ3_NELNU|nr:TPA_asm: hypothetical protein HUJ06_021124 [Nelumbo nucifera]
MQHLTSHAKWSPIYSSCLTLFLVSRMKNAYVERERERERERVEGVCKQKGPPPKVNKSS